MSAERYNPGIESAAKALRYRRWVGFRRLLYDPPVTPEDHRKINEDIANGVTMTEIREKLSLNMPLSAPERMLLDAIRMASKDVPEVD